MRTLLDEARDALAASNRDDYLGIAETCDHDAAAIMKEDDALPDVRPASAGARTPELLATGSRAGESPEPSEDTA